MVKPISSLLPELWDECKIKANRGCRARLHLSLGQKQVLVFLRLEFRAVGSHVLCWDSAPEPDAYLRFANQQSTCLPCI